MNTELQYGSNQISARSATEVQAPRSVPEVESLLSQQNHRLDQLQGAVNELVERIQRVMRQEPTREISHAAPAPGENSVKTPIGGILSNHNLRIEIMQDTLAAAIDRLEI